MRFPSKVTPYGESCLVGFTFIMSLLREGGMEPRDVFYEWRRAGYPADEFCATMDCLYALGSVELNAQGRLVGLAV